MPDLLILVAAALVGGGFGLGLVYLYWAYKWKGDE